MLKDGEAASVKAGDRAGTPLTMTNGRGAFSNSLAEYSVAAMLHFNKQLPRLAANKANVVWDNFVMDTMEGKTVGLVGYGSIGQATARMAKAAFGCSIVALRRQAAAGDPAGVADEVLGFEERDTLFRECDFVVCSLPKTVRDSPHRQGSSSFSFFSRRHLVTPARTHSHRNCHRQQPSTSHP